MLRVFVFICMLVFTEQLSTPQDATYRAAVVEYQANNDTTYVTVLQDFAQLIGNASQQNADIVVFPELTLSITGDQGAEVPIYGLLKTHPIPALNPTLYNEILVSMSSAARQRQVYVVVNILEELNCSKPQAPEEYCPEDKIYLFNTNVVFDRSGAVINRYRNINPFAEPIVTPALRPELGIFTTDFGVTFGQFICFDLNFQVPAIQIAEKHYITNIITSAMWYSEMPYVTAVEEQQAYAYSMNVNFLAAGVNNPSEGSAGKHHPWKQWYLFREISTIPGVPTTRLLVSTVPKVPGEVNFPVPGPIYEDPKVQDGLFILQDSSIPAHVTKPLVSGFQEFTISHKDVSCRFRVNLTEGSGPQTYKYRAAAYSGVRSVPKVNNILGNRVCSVISCTGDEQETCGRRFETFSANSTPVFEELSIIASVPTPVVNASTQAHDSHYFPLSLQECIMPLQASEFSYSEKNNGAITDYTFELKSKRSLYTFAVWGRVYGWDHMGKSLPTDSNSTIHISTTV